MSLTSQDSPEPLSSHIIFLDIVLISCTGRPGQPSEVATCFVFLASSDSSFMSGQSLHPNGGVVVGS